MNGRKFTSSLQNQLWAEVSPTAILLQNNFVLQKGAMDQFHQNYGVRGQTTFWIKLKSLVKSVLC